MKFALVLCLAVIADEIFGDPARFPHPVRMIGRVINFWHRIIFSDTESFFDGLAVSLLTIFTAGLFAGLTAVLVDGNVIFQVYALYSAIAWRDLKDETAPVFFALVKKDFDSARKYLSFVVGRDTENLDETEIARAVIETVAENSVDGVISVMFFAAIGYAVNPVWGMPVIVWAFKAASTLDSMIGYESFGRYGTASARIDDVMNFLTARIGGLMIVLTGGNFREALRVFASDRTKHKSPNSAHPESAFAGVLGLRLGGGAFYGGKFEARPFLNEAGNDPVTADIVRAWKVLDVSCFAFTGILVILSCLS